MPVRARIAVLVALLIGSGCATTESTTQFHSDDVSGFSRFLVVGQAGPYNSRSEFERLVVSELRERGASATAYHVAAGGDVPISRESIVDAVQSGDFEAVVITRVLNSDLDAHIREGATETLSTRRDNGLIDLFRYDYEDVTNPSSLDLEISVTIITELYDMQGRALVWSGKSSIPPVETVAELVSGAAVSVVELIDGDDLIAD